MFNRPDWIGQTLGGRYQIQELLGQGGMSSVYKALDPNLQRVVAIKMIHPHLSNDPKFTERFEEEARVVARLRHSNIVQVYDFNRDGDVFYMVQEFLPGQTLQSLLAHLNETNQRMSLLDVTRYAFEVSNAVGYAHSFGMIHRDIKPANIMIDERHQAILMDFGIVKLLGGKAHTTTGNVIGTALYMSPELIRGEAPDTRSDIYSLGVTLFEMLSGRPPFEAVSAMTLMMMHQNDPVPDLHPLRPEVPQDLVRIVEKSLAKTREARYSTAGELSSALRAVHDRLSGGVSIRSTNSGYTVRDGPPPVMQHNPDASSPTVRVTKDQLSQEQAIAAAGYPPTGYPAANNPPTGYPPGGTPPRNPSGGVGASQVMGGGTYPGYADRPASPTGTSTGQRALPPAAPEKKRNMVPYLAGGGVVLVILLTVCMVLAGISLRNRMVVEPTTISAALVTPTEVVVIQPSATSAPPTATETPLPTTTPTPLTPTALANFDLPAVPEGVPFVRLTGIGLDEAGRYVVDYETFEISEGLPGVHVHFFFGNAPLDASGLPEQGSYLMYGGPHPFAELRAADRPPEAVEICSLIASPEHVMQLDSGTCLPLPDLTVVTASMESPCRFGPGDEYPQLSSLGAGRSALADGLSPDEGWWYVSDRAKPGGFCWVSIETTKLHGDITSLKLVQPPPMPTGPVIGEGPYIEITGITLDAQANYLVAYRTHNFVEQLPGTHLHFFFDTTPADQTGITGGGERLMYGGPSPFSGYNVRTRPQGAKMICALVANPDHTVIPASGNCFALPEASGPIPTAAPVKQPKEPKYNY